MMFFKKSKDVVSHARGKVVPFLNQKGGVGKTTMCFNSAFALAKKGRKVLCIDMDPQANLSLLFDVDTSRDDSPSIHQLLVNSVRELKNIHSPCLIDDVIVEGEVDLLPAGQELSGFELTMAAISSPRQLILKKFIDKNDLLNRYDYIFIDCPPTLGLLVVNAICAGHGVIVPFRPDDFSKKGLQHFYDMMEDVQDMGIVQVPEVLAHIPNLMDNRRKQEESDLQEISQLVTQTVGENKLVEPFYNRSQLVKSQASRKSVFEYNSKEYRPLHQQFNQIADMIEDWNR